jgi:hypothetical protein
LLTRGGIVFLRDRCRRATGQAICYGSRAARQTAQMKMTEYRSSLIQRV